MKPSELLKQGWCQGKWAEYPNGSKVLYRDLIANPPPTAYKWCVTGAVIVLVEPGGQRSHVLRRVHELTGCKSLLAWNDHPDRTKAEVVAVMEQAELECGL